ncbi:GyrI-like domain-containing protein [Brevibacillus agri]|uniref:GyrI-like domain-containing protein n=1 Tax=Brevibacillus agri TaxID=51101 RepID=UPI002E1BD35B|nr:GyrI-like domain-containing protein [Brevibacillus agri]
MNPTTVQLGEMRVAGLKIRTTNEAECGANGKIGPLWHRYYEQGYPARTPGQKEPGVVYGVYSDYASDEQGAYSLLVGVEVEAGGELPAELTVKTIPAATYAVFTTRVGPMVEIIQEAWARIWAWSQESGVKRTFVADFERYDGVRCADPNQAQVDIYVAIEQK